MVSDREIENAVAVLRAGGLVAFPTETVYGLGADAANPEALKKVFAAKGRPHDHPLIVHVADAVQLANWARVIPPAAGQLAKKFWPGPLTIILRRAPEVSNLVTGGQDTVALRVPSHPVAQALLRAFGGGIAAPSANRFGRVSATTAEHVRHEFGAAVDCVLDGGAADVGIESTIVDLSGAQPVLLRPGWITARQLQEALEMPLAAPGAASPRVAVLARFALQPLLPGLAWIAAPTDAVSYAHDLYANLRHLDETGCDTILVEAPPQEAAWVAITDRLTRAAAGSAAPDAT